MSLPGIYTADVPQGNQQINNTQQPINTNFQDIYNLLAINHVPFNTANTFGQHNYVSYIQQGSDPSTSSTELALYSKSVSNDPNLLELFYRYPSNGQVVQLTPFGTTSGGGTITSGGTFTINNSLLPNSGFGYVVSGFWQYLTNNTLVITGYISNYYTQPISSPFTINFPGGLPVMSGSVCPSFKNTPYCILLTANSGYSSGNPLISAINPTSNSTATAYYQGTIAPAPSTIYTVGITIIGV